MLYCEIKKAQDPIIFVKTNFPNPNSNYSAQKNDEIDHNIMVYIQENPLPIKITKISQGKYFYGSLKIEIYLGIYATPPENLEAKYWLNTINHQNP